MVQTVRIVGGLEKWPRGIGGERKGWEADANGKVTTCKGQRESNNEGKAFDLRQCCCGCVGAELASFSIRGHSYAGSGY